MRIVLGLRSGISWVFARRADANSTSRDKRTYSYYRGGSETSAKSCR